ncbi:MAG: tetratricopeptide repeat protein, partial [Alphaproteobacteria bacterium]|nr:tetratricopeptide repeat protein [Alphaproteobacteria bacterium]
MKWIPKILTLVLAAGLALAGCQAETTPDKNPATSAQSMDSVHMYARFVELYAQGRNREALPFGEEAVRLGEQEFGAENPTVAKMIDSLGLLYASMGRYTEAEQHYLRALAIQEKAQGPMHPDVAHVLDLLANLYRDQRRYDEAEPLYKRAL